MIKNTGMVFSHGQMGKNMMAAGKKANNMAKQYLQIQKGKVKLEYGIMEIE